VAKFYRALAFVLLATLLTACDGSSTAPSPVTPVTPTPATPVELVEITINVEIPYPEDANVNRGIQGVTVICLNGCEGRQTEVTDDQGAVTFTGLAPITVQVEKSGYISVEQRVSDGSRVMMGNEWPAETEVAIRQTGLANVIASGRLFLIWADDKYLPELAREIGNANLGGWIDCSILIVRHYSDRRRMVGIVVHETAHGWIGLRTHNTTCNPSDEAWVATAEGRAWVEAIERDLDPETGPGPIVGFDDNEYTIANKYKYKLSELPRHSLAEFYRHWYGYGELAPRLCQLAPARCLFLSDYLGSRPM